MTKIESQFRKIIESIYINEEDLMPSEFAEKYRTLSSDVSTIQGKFKYNLTPYMREIVNTLSPYHPAKIVALMTGAQIGKTEGLIINGMLWMIANSPGNCLFLSANDDMSKESIESRLDSGLASCNLQHLIRPNTLRKRNNRTGDTSKSKEYSGGRMFAGGLNSIDKLSRQRSIKYAFLDDWDAAKISDKVQGNLFDLIQQRLSTSSRTGKQYYISTPETKPSNIDILYNKGDQRHWYVPCPECGVMIEILWSFKNKDGEKVGIYFEKEAGRLVESSVGYVCQECGKFFKEKYKYEINLHGIWKPTAVPSRSGFYSYQISNLVAAPHMYNWTHYAYQWLDIFQDGNELISKRKVFHNQVLGLAWEEQQVEIKKGKLIKNCREYEPGTIPNLLSIQDGNGMILLLTCSCDLNGTIDDARMEYEVLAHSETGSTYSIDAGSIGTNFPNAPKQRDLWTYKNKEKNNVWDFFWNEIINKTYHTDDGGERKIMLTGVDTGYLEHYAFTFIDEHPDVVVGLKGNTQAAYRKIGQDKQIFKFGSERNNLFILDVDVLKDKLSERINLKLTEGNMQPSGYFNFPSEGLEGKYTSKYFEQWENERKILQKNDDNEPVGYKWERFPKTAPNHFWDCGVYNLALRHIITYNICKFYKIQNGSWADFVRIIKNSIPK